MRSHASHRSSPASAFNVLIILPTHHPPRPPHLTVSRATARATSVEMGRCARCQRRGAAGGAGCDAAVRVRNTCVSFSLSPCHRCHFGGFQTPPPPGSHPKSRLYFSTPRRRRCTTRHGTARRGPPARGASPAVVGVAHPHPKVKIDVKGGKTLERQHRSHKISLPRRCPPKPKL